MPELRNIAVEWTSESLQLGQQVHQETILQNYATSARQKVHFSDAHWLHDDPVRPLKLRETRSRTQICPCVCGQPLPVLDNVLDLLPFWWFLNRNPSQQTALQNSKAAVVTY